MDIRFRTKRLNWATELRVSTEEENKHLIRAKENERRLLRKGYRWYGITPTYKVLIPFGEDGQPTEEGFRKIEKHKEMLNIV